MSKLFNIDNPLFTILSKICDMLFISIVFVLLCIPVVTIGPAYTALYYAVVKVIRRERGYIFREFFKSFKLNFKRSAIVGILFTIIFGILGYDLIFAWGMTADTSSTKASLLMGVFLGLTFLALCVFIYVFPILSRFDMTVKQLLKSGIYMSMKHIHFSVLMIIVNIAAVLGVYFYPPFLFIAPAVTVFVNSFMMEIVFKKYMPESSGSGEETGVDEWYLE
ncbi:MAG: YesL family protein [Clostridiales bacterium]|nr:YesL family protein [Clostridiales bacterium]